MESCKPNEYPSSETYVHAAFARELERENIHLSCLATNAKNAQLVLNNLAEEWTRRANEYAELAANIDQGQFTRVTAQHRAEVYALCAAEVTHMAALISLRRGE